MKILLSGGGTMGSVTPLIAVIEELREQNEQLELLWIGTKNGPEKEALISYNINFKAITSGRLNRFFDIKNFLTPFQVKIGFFQSLGIIKKFQPDVILTAGSFVCVPVAWAAKFLGKKVMVHQIDIRPGLANKLTAKIATKITVSFSGSLNDFDKNKTILTGNPYRKEILQGDKNSAQKIFNLQENVPTILVLGGGTGAAKLNEILLEAGPELIKNFQIIHVLGRGKYVEGIQNFGPPELVSRYHTYEYLKGELKHAFAAADLVITRAGMATITEISILEKPMIVFPIPNSHQEENANFFGSNNAAIVLNQNQVDGQRLTDIIHRMFNQPGELNRLKLNIAKLAKKDANQLFVNVLKQVISQ